MMCAMVAAGMAVGGCDNSAGSGASSADATTQRVQEDLHRAGAELKDAATTVSRDLQPALQRAGDEARQGLNAAANKVADLTATRPATQP
jgi:hypothetical protein